MIHLCLFDCTIRERSPAHFDVESCCWHGHWSRIARLFGKEKVGWLCVAVLVKLA